MVVRLEKEWEMQKGIKGLFEFGKGLLDKALDTEISLKKDTLVKGKKATLCPHRIWLAHDILALHIAHFLPIIEKE